MNVQIEIPFKSADIAEAAKKSLEGELTFQKRAKSSIERKGEKVLIRIEAEDISSLHAATSSFLRAIKIFMAVKEEKE